MLKNASFNLMLRSVRETVYLRKIGSDPSRSKISFISDNVKKLLGYKATDFAENPGLWISIIHPDDARLVEREIQNVLTKKVSSKSKKSIRLTYRIRHKKTKRYTWVEDVVTPQFDKSGRGVGIAGSLTDINGQKESESSPGKEVSSTYMFENAAFGIYRTTPDGRILYANRALVKMLGFGSLRELKERNLSEEGFEPPSTREDFLHRISSEGVVSGFEAVWKRKDGNLLFVRESAHVVHGEGGIYYEGTAEDITEVKLAQERIVRLNQILRTLSNINQLIIRNSTPEILFNEACRILVEDGKYRMAWIGVVDEGRKVVHPIAWNGIDSGALKEIMIAADGKPEKHGLIVEAIRTGLASVSNDLENESLYKLRHDEERRHGVRSAGAFPIRISGNVVGVVNVFAGSPNSFSQEEVHLLSELADDIGFALWTIEVRAREKSTYEAIKDREFWLSESQRVARIGSYVFDIKSGTYSTSPMIDEILGVDSGFKLDIDNLMSLVHPEERVQLAEYFKEVISEKKSFNLEYRIVRPSDRVERWMWCRGELMLDSAGEPASYFGTIQDITDRKRAEEAQERERILLRTLIDHLPSAVFVKDKEYRKTIVNDQHVKSVAAHLGRLGLNPEQDILGKTDFDIYPKELAEKYLEDDQKIIRDGESILNKVETGIKADGRQSWVLVSKVPLRDRNGQIEGLVGITTEITAQKEAEELQKRERILLRTLIDNLPHSVYVKDKNYHKIIANPANLAHTGLKSEAEIIGKTDFDLFPKEEAEKFFIDDQRVIRDGRPILNREEYVIDPEGKKIWLLTTKVPLRDEGGTIVGLIGIGIDITERRRVEDMLRESEERFRAIFENTAIGFYRTTPDGRVLFANPAMVKILGFRNLDELVKFNVEEEGHYQAAYPRAKFRELIEQKGFITGLESKKIRPDGSVFWVRENARVVYDTDGKVAYYEGTLEDISEHKQAEEALERERALLKTLIDNLPSSVFVKDGEYRKTVVNRAHVSRLSEDTNRPELAESEILGKTDFDLYPREEAEIYFLDDQKVLQDGQIVLDREEPRTYSDGKKRWISVSKIPIRAKAGEIVGLLGIVSDITERKLAEEERERERILLRTLIDNIPNAIFVKDKEYREVLVNRAHVLAVGSVLKNIGSTFDDDILGRTDFEVYPKEMAEKFFLEDRKVIEDGIAVMDREEFRVDKSGSKHWALVTKIPLRDEKDNINGFVGITTDITSQKTTEEALRASEAELRTLFASMKDVVLVLDSDGRYVKVAPTDPKLLYKPAAELIGKTLHEIFSKEQADEFLSITRKALEAGELQNTEYKLEIDGRETWFNASLSKMDEERVLLVARDITAHKQAEEALRKSEEVLAQITTSIDDTIYSIDGRTAEFTYLSPVFERKLGYSISDIEKMGGRWAFLKQVVRSESPAGDDPVVADLQKHVVQEIPLSENWWRCKDGTLLYIEDKSVPIYDGERLVRIDGVLRDITEWKTAEDEKQRERILLRTLIDNTPYAVYIKDKECRKVTSNPTDVHLVGRNSEEEVLGKTDFEFFPREIAEKFFADDQAVIRDGKPVLNREEYLYDHEGKKHWLLTYKIPWVDAKGNIVGLVGMGVDITERKAVEEALRRSESELRTLFESMKDIILVLDKDGRFLRVAPTEDSLLYKPSSELMGKKSNEIFPREQADYFVDVIRKTLESGEPQNAEYSINIRGEEKWRTATVSPLTNDSVLWVARDITERKLMEKELRDSEKKYRELVENALVAVYRTTLSGRIIYANKAMADMLEYSSPMELISIRAYDLYRNIRERESFVQELRTLGETGKTNEVEWVTKTGKIRNVLLSASLDGEIISGMAKDITDIRMLEQQFLQTQKLEGLGNIAAGIAHDFNNILGVILGYADLLTQSAFDQKKFQRGTQAIMKSAERGKSLVKQLLTFARKTETTFESVQVNEIVSELEKLVEETFPKTVVITTELRNDLPVFSGDATQIHQVLLNICVNARDAMPRGGKLTISTNVVSCDTLLPVFPEASAGKYVEIRIEDNGTGMDEETRRRIFEPFFTTKEVGKGTGLGLSVAYGIMQSHRGFISVTSEPKKGSTFSIYFPVFEEPIENGVTIQQSPEEISGGTDTVLIIEDEEMLRDLLKAILEPKGYKVLAASDGQEAMQTFQKNKDQIAVVLSDLGLPKLSGEEIVSHIKRVNPEVKVIMASGFIDPEIRSVLEAAGVKDFIQKPYMANEVLKVVREAIDRGKV
ncbi:MAG TPA: PAS domain S-box protein [Candidatus Acidoferrales bacterium]|nr:PAS domain S-box protein [Candidatus Acidoferrales bacterium]